MPKSYCVVYRVCGIHYHYRCTAKTKKSARKMCCEYMGCTDDDIIDVYVED